MMCPEWISGSQLGSLKKFWILTWRPRGGLPKGRIIIELPGGRGPSVVLVYYQDNLGGVLRVQG